MDALGRLSVFASLGAAQLATLNEAGDLARLGPGEPILSQGETPAELIFLVTGAAAATQHDGPRGEAVTDVLLPPIAIACPAALLGLPSPVGVRTIVSSRLVIVPAAAVRSLIEQDATVGQRFLAYALGELHRMQAETCKLKLRSSVQRLAQYLLALAGEAEEVPARFVLPFEKRFLAGKIGCSRENLSRAFAALRRLGVETQRGVVVIRDVAALRAFAGP